MSLFPEISKELNSLPKENIVFSICTLVSNSKEYKVMVETALEAGFNNSFCEYLYINNEGNKYDAYSGLNRFISISKGKYLIICHQDVEFIYDKAEVLIRRIEEINEKDSDWGVLGNVGGLNLHGQFMNITEKKQHLRMGNLPQRVNSLDENFLILRKSANLSFSKNLTGFHFYGTDICIISNILGLSCWAIDFHLLHKSSGNLSKNFYLDKLKFVEKYQKAFGVKFIRTSCTRIFVSPYKALNKIMNTSFGVFLTRILYKSKKEKAY